jgi:uncharacterized protein
MIISSQYRLVIPMVQEQETIIRLLDALFPGVKIYLFGSRARGTNAPTADIDLALDAGHKLSLEDIARAHSVLEGLYLVHKIDVVDILSVPDYLRDRIMKEKVVWKS